MKVKEYMQVIANLRFEVYNEKEETKSILSIRDFGNGYLVIGGCFIIKIYKLSSEIGFEYELLESIKEHEYLDFLRNEEIMNMEIAKECEISILPRYSHCNGSTTLDTTGCLLKLYVKGEN